MAPLLSFLQIYQACVRFGRQTRARLATDFASITRSSAVDETPDVMKHVCKTAHVRSVVGHRNVLCGTIGKVSVWSFDRYIGSDESRELGGAVAVSV